MVRVGVRIISWYIWCNFEKFIDCRTRSFTKSLYDCRTPRHFVKNITISFTHEIPFFVNPVVPKNLACIFFH